MNISPVFLLSLIASIGTGLYAFEGSECYALSKKNISTESHMELAMVAGLPQDVVIEYHPNGTVAYLKGKNASKILEENPDFQRLQTMERFGEIALAFIDTYRSIFTLENPTDELIVSKTTIDDLGYKHIRLRQSFANLPVWKAEIIVHLDRLNHVYLVQGIYIPTPSLLSTDPQLDPDEAKRRVMHDLTGSDSECPRCQIELVIFFNHEYPFRLAYHVDVTLSLTRAWSIIIDAETGVILEKYPNVHTAGKD